MILLHGGGGTWESFMTVIPPFSDKWHIYAIDHRGHGSSARVENGYHIASYANDVVEFLQSKSSNEIYLWGQSLGANIAIEVAASCPEIVRAVILEEPTVDVSIGEDRNTMIIKFRDLAALGYTYDEVKADLEETSVPGQEENVKLKDIFSENDLSFAAKSISAMDSNVMDAILDGSTFRDYDVGRHFSQLSCPALFLQGNPARGGMADDHAEYGVSLIPNCKHVYVETAGHNLHRTQPGIVINIVEEFLASVVRS
jgi:pimeloyl-ACP methyl ester carboxylesterase